MSKYVNFDRIDSTGANIRMMYSMRSNGKTYGALLKCLELAKNHGGTFFYLRRRSSECTATKMKKLFLDMPYEQYLGEDILIGAEGGEFFTYRRKKEKRIDKTVIGYYGALDKANELKSTKFVDTTLLVYDEFLSSRLTGIELIDEYTLFINTISTIRRTRPNFVVYMLGNTVNRHSVYFDTWGINIDDIGFGDLKVYEYEGGNRIAVEYAKTDIDDTNKLFVFGTPKEQAIINGVWETSAYPTFEQSKIAPKIKLQYLLMQGGIKLFCGFRDGTLYVSDTSFECYDTVVIADIPTNAKNNIFNISLDVSQSILSVIFSLHKIGQSKFNTWNTGDAFEQFQQTVERGV